MNISADQVRAATRSAAAVITADKLPPLRLDEASAAAGGRARKPVGRQARSVWFAPLAAAAAVAIVVAGSVAAGSWLGKSGTGRAGGVTPGTSAAGFAEVPPYYVAVDSASQAVVRATATGAVLARIPTRTPFVGVAGAADDRTFVLDAQRQVVGPSVTWPDPPKFYLLRLTAAGAEQSFTPLSIPAFPKGVAVTGLALSPDASKLAIAVDTAHLLEIRVYTLATGKFRAWSTHGSTDPEDPDGFTGSGVDGSETISWTADARTLAFDWSTSWSNIGVRLLDTTASGDNLIADSRLAVTESHLTPQPGGSKDNVSQCVTDSIISLDGSAIVCGYTTGSALPHNKIETTTGFIRYSARTGKQTAVLGVYRFNGQAPGDISLYWVNSTGNILIGAPLTPRGVQVGVIDGAKFTPLPGVSALGAAAW